MPNKCVVGECGRIAQARGMCHTHYERWRCGRDLGGEIYDNPRQRFMSKVTDDGDCWIWLGATDGDGRYGSVWDGRQNRAVRAHRWALENIAGVNIPEGLVTDHVCRRTLCVNPQHLELVTQRENIRRGNWGSGINARKTHCPSGHPLQGNNVVVRNGGRRARAGEETE